MPDPFDPHTQGPSDDLRPVLLFIVGPDHEEYKNGAYQQKLIRFQQNNNYDIRFIGDGVEHISLKNISDTVSDIVSEGKSFNVFLFTHGKPNLQTGEHEQFFGDSERDWIETNDIVDTINRASGNKNYDVMSYDIMASSCYGSEAEDAAMKLRPGSKYVALSPSTHPTYIEDILDLIDTISQLRGFENRPLDIDTLFECYLPTLNPIPGDKMRIYPEIIVSGQGKHNTEQEVRDLFIALRGYKNYPSLTLQQNQNIQAFIDRQPEPTRTDYQELYEHLKTNVASGQLSILTLDPQKFGLCIGLAHAASSNYETTAQEILNETSFVDGILQNNVADVRDLIFSSAVDMGQRYDYHKKDFGLENESDFPLFIALQNHPTLDMVQLLFENTPNNLSDHNWPEIITDQLSQGRVDVAGYLIENTSNWISTSRLSTLGAYCVDAAIGLDSQAKTYNALTMLDRNNLLVDHINRPNRFGLRPLSTLSQKSIERNIDAFEFLLEKGADPTLIDTKEPQYNALDWLLENFLNLDGGEKRSRAIAIQALSDIGVQPIAQHVQFDTFKQHIQSTPIADTDRIVVDGMINSAPINLSRHAQFAINMQDVTQGDYTSLLDQGDPFLELQTLADKLALFKMNAKSIGIIENAAASLDTVEIEVTRKGRNNYEIDFIDLSSQHRSAHKTFKP